MATKEDDPKTVRDPSLLDPLDESDAATEPTSENDFVGVYWDPAERLWKKIPLVEEKYVQ